jgi:hypothetical protein
MPVLAEGNPIIPVADPALLKGVGGLAPLFVDPAEIRPLVSFLQTHRQGERYLLATPQLMLAALIIVETGEPVIATGGFMGTAPVLPPEKFAQLATAGQLRYALVPHDPSVGGLGRPPADGAGRGSTGCRMVNPALWRPDSQNSNSGVSAVPSRRDRDDPRWGTRASHPQRVSVVGFFLRQMDLYDCGPSSDTRTSNPQSGR